LRQTGVDTWFKIYANGRYWEADQRYDDLWVVGIGKTGGFSGTPGSGYYLWIAWWEMRPGVSLVAEVSVVRDHTSRKVFG